MGGQRTVSAVLDTNVIKQRLRMSKSTLVGLLGSVALRCIDVEVDEGPVGSRTCPYQVFC